MARPPSEDAAALRLDLAECVRLASGGAPASGLIVQGHAADFLERASLLRRAFAREVLWAREQAADEDESAAAMRAEIAALRIELRDKEALIASHRQRVQRWDAECAAVAAACGGDASGAESGG